MTGPGPRAVGELRTGGEAAGRREDASSGSAGAGAPLTVLFVHYGGDWIRGSETVLLDLLRFLDRDRIRPLLACNHQVLAAAARKLEVDSFHVDRPTVRIDGRATRIEPLRWWRTVGHLAELGRRLGAGLFYSQNAQPSQVAYYAGRRLGAPCMANIQSFYPRRDVHLMRLTRLASLIFCSEAVRERIAARTRLRGSLEVIHNAVDLERFHPSTSPSDRLDARARAGVPDGAVVIGQVGSLIHRKGVDLLVAAVRNLIAEGHPVHLVLVGSGPMEPAYRAQVEEMGLIPHVTFAGDLAEPDGLYRNVFDINVLASREEAFGVALVEGAASGLPLVAARTGGMREIVRDGTSGLLFEPGDSDDLTASLRRLVIDARFRAVLGRAARADAEERFSVRVHVRRVQEAIHRAAGRASASRGRPRP